MSAHDPTSELASIPTPAGRPLRILIVRVGAMGDILHALPAVAALRAREPTAWVGWAIEPRWQALLTSPAGPAAGDLVDRLHPVPTRAWNRRPLSFATAAEILALRRALRAERYDVCVDLQGSIRSAVIGWLAGAPRFVGPAEPREGAATLLYGERVQTPARHVIDQACELLTAATASRTTLDLGGSLSAAAAPLPHDPGAERTIAQLLARAPGDGPAVLLAPSAGWAAKQWPAAKFRALAERLGAAGCRVLINAASASDPLAASVVAGGVGAVAACTIAELIALARRVDLVVGGDSGPVHLAAALGRPVVALFGPTDPARNGPHFPGAHVAVLRHPTSQVDHRRHRETEPGLARITVEEVEDAAHSLLAAAGERKTHG